MQQPVPEEFVVEVDGQHFRIWTNDPGRHRYNYDWLDGPRADDGFSSSTRHYVPTSDDHTHAVRNFLEQVDPETGLLTD